ncbi:MAG: DUF6382 domain-containing protein [Agathobacter sp.]
MINREITYKRDINKSYMIIPTIPEDSFDEKLLLKRTIGNLLPVEKCYMASVGQYWYDITGKQALDAYCRIHSVGKEFFENLILKLCQMVELLEWNLVDVNCLVLDPELVFLNVYDEDVYFVAYPFHKGDLTTELHQLLEYLLTKLNHKDTVAVGWAYKLYELSLVEGMSIEELKKEILEERAKKVVVEMQRSVSPEMFTPDVSNQASQETTQEISFFEGILVKGKEFLRNKVGSYQERFQKLLKEYIPQKQDESMTMPIVVYPEEEQEAEIVEMHPTVCISSVKNTRRELSCDRKGVYPDFILDKSSYIVGKSTKAQFRIDKDTVSQFHARIEYQGDVYYIEDLNSTNGTYVNDQLLSYKVRRQLQSGDSIRFGDVGYHFC